MDLSYTNVESFIKPIFMSLKMRSHRLLKLHPLKAIIFIIYGIVHSQSLEYARIARHVPTDKNHNHTKKRIYRFINNDDIDMGLLMVLWCKFMVGLLYRLTEYVPVIVDITWVKGEKYIKAAIPFFCRAYRILNGNFDYCLKTALKSYCD